MKSLKGFSLIEIIVAIAIMAILAGAIAPVVFRQLDQSRYSSMEADLKSLYVATMGNTTENYFGFVGDVGRLPDSVDQLIDSTGQGVSWNGPYLSLGGSINPKDVYGDPYIIDTLPIRARSYGPDKTNNSGAGDDIIYPLNPLSTYKGDLQVQVYINGKLLLDAASELVSAVLNYSVNGTPSTVDLDFDASDYSFKLPFPVHQGIHNLNVTAAKATLDPVTVLNQDVTILPGATTRIQVAMQDADYMTRSDTDLNGNGIADRLEDMDGDGIPDSMDQDIDGDGTPNIIDPDSLDATVGGGGGISPIVSAVTPSYGTQGDSMLVTIDGLYFETGPSVTFSGTGVTVLTSPATWLGSTQITATITISAGAATGLRNVNVTNASGVGGIGSNLFEVLATGGTPSPTISVVSPETVSQASSSTLISVQGQNFQSGAVISFSGVGTITITSGPTFLSSNEIQATIDATAASPATGSLILTNPDSRYASTAFTVSAATLSVTSLTPNTASRNTSGLAVAINGSDFISGLTVTSVGTNAAKITINSYTWASSALINMQINTNNVTSDKEVWVKVTNPGGFADTASFFVTKN